jgi:hypothetical protein
MFSRPLGRMKSRPFTRRLRVYWKSDMLREEKQLEKLGLWKWHPISSGKVKDRYFHDYYA